MFSGGIFMNERKSGFIGPRAMNDYTANLSETTRNNMKRKFVEPLKSAMCIATSSAMEPSLINKYTTKK